MKSFDAFLVPSGDWEETSFRVVAMAPCKKKLVVFGFSSSSGCWGVAASTTWDNLAFDISSLILSLPRYVYGCFYWKVHKTNKLLKLDMSRMEFSTVDLQHDIQNVVVVEAGEGRLGMFSRIRHGTVVDHYTIVQYESDGANRWRMKNILPLPANYKCYISGSSEGYIFLVGIPEVQSRGFPTYFSLEIKTLEIEMVGRIRFPFYHLCPYFGFPPSMAPRRI
ncbi:hypothetical protein ACP70R_005638 [Stipagrostis hirtigluma subsp. patula]